MDGFRDGERETGRRGFLAAGAAGAFAAILGGRTTAADGAEREPTDLEKANMKVVTDFCDTWETLDAAKIASFFTDDAVYRLNEKAAPAVGREVIEKRVKMFLGMSKSARFEILRQTAMHTVVLNERYDHFVMGDKQRMFHVVGIFFMIDGKIQEWTDYTGGLPGGSGADAH